MLTSKAFILTTMAFALFSFYALFYSLFQTQLKFEDTSDLNLLSQENSTTWFQPKVRVVMVIIDAFRFDYLLNYKNSDHKKALQVNKLKGFNNKFFQHSERFVVLRALADAPTMTVLRVPCLMTGNVPRLGSVLTAFGAIPSKEDSVPRQLYLQNKKSYFSGDPILKEYFPKYLESDYKIGSFNIHDWTVDQPVHSYINKKIKENNFDFLASHLLRLDHAGHSTANLASHQVLNALRDIDKFLVNLINTIDDDTMLLFAGDHGMSQAGYHGGGTQQETNTAIVAYHKKGFMKYQNRGLKKIMRSVNETDDQVHQVNLAPTLSMLMGLPTPFSNMGQIINDLYPVGDYLPQQDCPNNTSEFNAAFDMQLLHDNHLNTLQVWNYFKKYHEGQTLFNHQEFSQVSDLFQENEALYKAAQTMIAQSQQCENDFHKTVTKAIKQSQKLSNQIHDLVSTKTPHDLVIFWQAFAILALVGTSYVLLVQYLYKTKDYEHITWTPPKDLKSITKTLIPILILLSLIWTFMLANSPKIMRPITSTVLVFALWILGSSILTFLFKYSQEESSQSIPSSSTNEEKQQRPPFSLKKFFMFQHPLITAGAIAIIGYLFYLTHVLRLDKFTIMDLKSYAPHAFVLLAGTRLSGRYLKHSPYIMGASVLLTVGLHFGHPHFFFSKKGNLTMGLLLAADWLWGEMQFAMFKLKAGRVWSFQYVICFMVLVLYHLVCDPGTEFVKIILPRFVWAIVILSSLAGFALRMPKKVTKRNIQVNLVLFLILMQLHKQLIFFTILLSLMRIASFVFKRAHFKNYLYPLFLGLMSYVGLFFIGFQDRKLPRSFEAAFVGMKEFHLGLCLFLYGSAMLSTIILGMLFISFYDQDLESQAVKLGIQKEESDCQVVALKGYSNIIKKRNILMYCFFYNLIILGAAINPVTMKAHKKVHFSMERFLVDGVFYLFIINAIYFMI